MKVIKKQTEIEDTKSEIRNKREEIRSAGQFKSQIEVPLDLN